MFQTNIPTQSVVIDHFILIYGSNLDMNGNYNAASTNISIILS